MTQPGGFDWPALLRLGLHGLGLHPEAFWQLTPAELRVMLGAGAAHGPMSQDRLKAMMTAFPDRKLDGQEELRNE